MTALTYPERMAIRALPGVGDEATWGECTGHPADPRTSELDEDALDAMGDAMAGQILHSAALDAQRIHDPLARMATHIGRLQGEIRRLCADLVWAREAQS